MTQFPATAEETAAEYLNAGLWSDGTEILNQAIAAAPDPTKIQPLVYYYLGYFAEKMNQPQKAAEDYALAAKMPSDYVFPFQNEAIDVLHAAMKSNPKDAQAPYYLGNLLFDSQPDEAIALWQSSAALDPSNAIVHRNLGIAFAHRKSGNSIDKAVAQMELAVSLPHKYALHFTELDEMYEAEGVAPEKRLALLEENSGVVAQRDDSLAREINLSVAAGKFDQAIVLLDSKEFAVWEGGTLSVSDDWADAHLLRGRLHFEDKQYQEAVADFKAALDARRTYPPRIESIASRRPITISARHTRPWATRIRPNNTGRNPPLQRKHRRRTHTPIAAPSARRQFKPSIKPSRCERWAAMTRPMPPSMRFLTAPMASFKSNRLNSIPMRLCPI